MKREQETVKKNRCLHKIPLPFILLVLFFLLLFSSNVTASILEDVFEPLKGLDIPAFYETYSTLLDAIIFLIIFIGLAQVTLGKRFGDTRGAKAIVVGVGIALALALVITEHRMNFSLAQFGPFAAGIFILLAASLLFYLLKTLGVGGVASFSTSYVIVYFLLRAVVPNFFDYIHTNAAGLHGLIALGALVSLIIMFWGLASHFWPGHMEKISTHIEEIPGEVLKKGKAAAMLTLERRTLKGKLAEIQKQRSKDSEAIITDLDNIIIAIDKYGDTPQNRNLIAQTLSQDVIPRERRLSTSLRALRKLYERVEKLDIGLLQKIKGLPPAERKVAKEELQMELGKLRVEEKIKNITTKISEYDKVFRDRIRQAVREINADRLDSARRMILEARESEDKIKDFGDEIDELTKVLRGLTSKEIVGSEK